LPPPSGGLAAVLPGSAIGKNSNAVIETTFTKLDEVLQKPVLKKELFTAPVIIESLELLRYKNSFLCRVRSKDGAEG
jgi:hypothetical protein